MKQKSAKEFPSFLGTSQAPAERAAVILAGGEGSRLKQLTRSISGDDRPKQFCPLMEVQTLLDMTRARVALGIAPENTYFSLTEKHERFYRAPLWNVRHDQLIIQPENKGTAPAILYSLMRLAQSSPAATVAFFPSDHYFSDDEAFMLNVDKAFSAVEVDSSSIMLLGVEPNKAETSYGWIEPAPSLFGDIPSSFSRVGRFWEKPAVGTAKKLMATGGLWNSFVMVGKVEAFLDLFRKHLPDMFSMFAGSSRTFGTRQEKTVISSIYAWIHETNFSSEVLERSSSDLLVMRVADVTWSDLGEPERVLGALETLGFHADWMYPIAA